MTIGINDPNLTSHWQYSQGSIVGTVFTAEISEDVDTLHALIGHAWGLGGPFLVKAAIYDWATGELLASSSEVEVPYVQGDSWYNFTLPHRVQIIAGKQYYLCLVIGGSDFAIDWMDQGDGLRRSYVFGIQLNSNKDLSDQPPANLNGNVLPVSPCDTTIFGVCSYQPWRSEAIYADLSGALMSALVSPATATALINQARTFSIQISGGTPPYSISWMANGVNIGSGTTVSIAFSTAGNYTIQVQVTDSSVPQQTVTATAQFVVNPLPTPQSPTSMPPPPVFPDVPEATPIPSTFNYTLDLIGGNFVIKDSNGTVVYSNADPQQSLQQLIDLTASLNGSALVKNLETITMTGLIDASNPSQACALRFTDYARIYLENGLTINSLNPATQKAIMKFDGRWANNMRKGAILEALNGRAKIVGAGTGGVENGFYLRCADHIQVRHLEVSNLAEVGLTSDGDADGAGAPAYNDYNYFEDIYLHGYSLGIYPLVGFGADGSHCVFKNITIDGGLKANDGFFIWGQCQNSQDNIVQDLIISNCIRNGVYLFGNNKTTTSRNFFRRVHIHDCAITNQGYSGFKYRFCSHNVVEDLLVESCWLGLTVGTFIAGGGPPASSNTGTDAFGMPNDGWSRGNRFIRTVLRNNRAFNLNLDIDDSDTGVEQNYFDVHIIGGGSGIWFNNGGESGGDGIQRDNTFFVTIEDCRGKAIVMEADAGNGGLTYRNRITGVIKNCPIIAEITDLAAMDNYFDLAIIGGGTITDNGTRNRWNGVGKLPSGQIAPVASEWNDGDIVVSGATAWLKTGGAMQQLSAGQTIPQFTYMEGKGGLPSRTTQFIDKSFVSGRTIAGWLWYFGDGTAASTLQHPVHPYGAKGTYNVTLTVTDNLGNQTTVAQAVDVTEEGIVYRTLTILPSNYGTTNPVAGTYSIVDGQTAIVFFTPNTGYELDHWELDGIPAGSDDPIHVLMTADHTLKAIFAQLTFNLTISTNDTLMGTTSPTPNTYAVPVGTTQQVAAIPSTGYMFDHWELDGVNVGATSSYSVTMDKDHAILAVFVEKPPPPPGKQHLTISTTTGGTTTPAPGVWEYDQGNTAQVTATSNTGYKFTQWKLDNTPITPVQSTLTVVMDADHALIAVFEPVPPTPTLWTWPFLTWLRNLIRQRQG